MQRDWWREDARRGLDAFDWWRDDARRELDAFDWWRDDARRGLDACVPRVRKFREEYFWLKFVSTAL